MARRLTCAFFAGFLVACSGAEPSPPGPDCLVLLELVERASACDSELEPLAIHVRVDGDESACRVAARRILEPANDDRPIRSTFDPSLPDGSRPLDANERDRLAALVLPATLSLHPDLPRGPGVPPTSATLDETRMRVHDDGKLSVRTPPGAHKLRIAHADREREYCVVLRACDHLEIVAHGATLPRHEAVQEGPCQDSVPDVERRAAN